MVRAAGLRLFGEPLAQPGLARPAGAPLPRGGQAARRRTGVIESRGDCHRSPSAAPAQPTQQQGRNTQGLIPRVDINTVLRLSPTAASTRSGAGARWPGSTSFASMPRYRRLPLRPRCISQIQRLYRGRKSKTNSDRSPKLVRKGAACPPALSASRHSIESDWWPAARGFSAQQLKSPGELRYVKKDVKSLASLDIKFLKNVWA